jgi:hypothetical protein
MKNIISELSNIKYIYLRAYTTPTTSEPINKTYDQLRKW